MSIRIRTPGQCSIRLTTQWSLGWGLQICLGDLKNDILIHILKSSVFVYTWSCMEPSCTSPPSCKLSGFSDHRLRSSHLNKIQSVRGFIGARVYPNLVFDCTDVEVPLYTPQPENILLRVEVLNYRSDPPSSCSPPGPHTHTQPSSHRAEPGIRTRHRNQLRSRFHMDPEPRYRTPCI